MLIKKNQLNFISKTAVVTHRTGLPGKLSCMCMMKSSWKILNELKWMSYETCIPPFKTCITTCMSVSGLHTLFKEFLMWHHWAIKACGQRDTFIGSHMESGTCISQFRLQFSFIILIFTLASQSIHSMLKRLTMVFYSPLQYKLAKQYIQPNNSWI